MKGSNYSTYAPFLVKAGFNSTGNQVLYNGMTGEQIQSDIYIGPTYYMRLKHMVKDKINYRATGPRTNLTRQTVQGRANDGGLRIGEMERDGVLAHGMSYFLNESFLIRGDEYYMAVCNKTGAIAIYNEIKNLFLSPFADGPVKFHTNPDGSMNVQNISKFGRSFSLLRIPYSFKLLIQELQTMNIQMRIITDENVDQMLSLSYSNNINELLQTPTVDISTTTSTIQNEEIINLALKMSINKLKRDINDILTSGDKSVKMSKIEDAIQEIDSEEKDLPIIPINIKPPETPESPLFSDESVPYAPGSPAYESDIEISIDENNLSDKSTPFNPANSTDEFLNEPILIKKPIIATNVNQETISQSPIQTPSQPTTATQPEKKSILEIEEKPVEVPNDKSNNNENNQNTVSSNTSESNNISNNTSNTNETKKIIIPQA
jgi:hypothetical protein